MRRYVLLAAIVPPILVAAAAATVPGCGEEFEDICAFLKDPKSCYASFYSEVSDRCGVQGESSAPTGRFISRETLDVCFFDGGGQVVFDPPLDITAFPPKSIAFKRLDAQAQECGTFTYSGEFTYSATINPCGRPEADGGGGAGGSLPSCEDGSDSGGGGGTGGGTVNVSGGTVTLTTPEGRDVLDVSCADGTSHHFNRIDAERKCDTHQQLLPRAVVESSPGNQPPPAADPADPEVTQNFAGFISFRVHYPPLDPQVDNEGIVEGTAPTVVEYFNCLIPPPAPLCFNGQKDGPETDVDCGGTLCEARCGDGSSCVSPADCASGICEPEEGFLKCQKADQGTAGAGGGGGGAGG